MKFGKLLQELIDENPAMNEQPLIRYKELKKHLKNIKKQQGTGNAEGQQQEQQQQLDETANAAAQAAQQRLLHQQEGSEDDEDEEGQHAGLHPGEELPADLSAEEQAFINMLNEDLCRFNRFFMDKEEVAVIKLQALADRIAAAQGQGPDDATDLKAALVDFHGEMVLLLHWSLLNYAAVVKILKKHDKQSGLLLRAPYLANVLQQPFYSTSIMSRLVKTAEGHIESLVAQEARHTAATQAAAAAHTADANVPTPAAAAAAVPTSATPPAAAAEVQLAPAHTKAAAAVAPAGPGGPGGEGPSDPDTEELLAGTAVCARTRVALQTWHQLCSNASTPSTVLPANSSQALVRALNVRQRWAKIVSMAPIMQQAGMDPTAVAEAAAAAEGAAAAGGAPAGAAGAQQDVDEAAAAASAEQRQDAGCGGDNGSHAGQKHKEDGQAGDDATTATKRQRLDS